MASDAIRWRGWGRWLAFLLGALLIFYGAPLFFNPDTRTLGGGYIFLGLLIAGAVGSGTRHAPGVALTIALLLMAQVAIDLIVLTWSVASLSDILLFLLGARVAADLWRQKRLAVQS